MAQRIDVMGLLINYARKHQSAYVETGEFMGAMRKTAERFAATRPEWTEWQQDTEAAFWRAITPLVEAGSCKVIEGKLYLYHFYMDKLEQVYKSIAEKINAPYPNGDNMKVYIPPADCPALNIVSDLGPLLDSPRGDKPMVKFLFPGNIPPILVPVRMLPDGLLATAVSKVRLYLENEENKEYVLQKLRPQLPGRESQIKSTLSALLNRSSIITDEMQGADDFAFSFWASLCNTIKQDVKKKNEFSAADVAMFQSAQIIEVFNVYFRSRKVRQHSRAEALQALEARLEQPPILFTWEQIWGLTASEIPELKAYSPAELRAYLKQRCTDFTDNALPDLLLIKGPEEEWYYIKKKLMLPYCVKLLGDVRDRVKSALLDRWLAILRQFRKEPAMEKTAEYEKLLGRLVLVAEPKLIALLDDPQLGMVYDEMPVVKGEEGDPVKLFNRGALMPLSRLLMLRRKEMLQDTKMLLPFWYCIPVLPKLIAFFKSGKNAAPLAGGGGDTDAAGGVFSGKPRTRKQVLKDLEAALVPEGLTLSAYMDDLEKRWGLVLKGAEQKNMVEDVQSLVRDRLRQSMKLKGWAINTSEELREMAAQIIIGNAGLQRLNGQDRLLLYIQGYILKLLQEGFKPSQT